jgi:superfamily II DNA helicase RecQ
VKTRTVHFCSNIDILIPYPPLLSTHTRTHFACQLLRLREALATHKQKLGVVERELSLVTDALAGAKSGENRKRAAVETHPWSKAARAALKKTFGLSDFREYQLEVINATMAKHDVFFVAPTGGGKSLTFMLPGILDGFARGFTLVISPLIALMQDQVAYLTRIGVRAAMLATGIPRADINAVHKVMVAEDDASNPLRFVFVTPERVGSSKMFNARLESAYRNNR